MKLTLVFDKGRVGYDEALMSAKAGLGVLTTSAENTPITLSRVRGVT
jgi:hypothetical protein